jgi:hypothetical protein
LLAHPNIDVSMQGKHGCKASILVHAVSAPHFTAVCDVLDNDRVDINDATGIPSGSPPVFAVIGKTTSAPNINGSAVEIHAMTALTKLLDHKDFNPHLTNDRGDTALIHACRAGKKAAAHMLLDRSGTEALYVNIYGSEAVHWAAKHGWTEIVVELALRRRTDGSGSTSPPRDTSSGIDASNSTPQRPTLLGSNTAVSEHNIPAATSVAARTSAAPTMSGQKRGREGSN